MATLVPLALDRRLLDFESVWAKPLKFDLALAVHLATLAMVALGPAWRSGGMLMAVAVIAVACTIFEAVRYALSLL